MDISVIIPVLNEEDNVITLFNETNTVLKGFVKTYEIIFVDDGSWDKTYERLSSIKDHHLVIVKLRANFGQSAAMDAGIKTATGKIVVMMDGDLQNDPKDIPLLIEKMAEGYDVVSGWRYKRKDPFGKRIASRIAFRIRKKIAKLDIHDSGCSLKAYTKESLEDIDLTGEMHRFIPDLCAMRGFRVGEAKVNHRPRVHGATKYKASRMLKGLLDLVVIYYWQRFAKRPMHFFGGVGALLILIGGIIDSILIFNRLVFGTSLANRPLFILANFVLLMGVQFFMTGIIADIAMKNYYKTTKKMNYSIEKIERR
jgi:glycosyltransferase involved in cell wall biosynthesis